MTLRLQGLLTACRLDSGSPISFVSKQFAQKTGGVLHPTHGTDARFISIDGTPFCATHFVRLNVHPPDWSYPVAIRFFVISSAIDVLIGEDAMSELGCILNYANNSVQFLQRVATVSETQPTKNSEFLKCFDLGELSNCKELKSLLIEFRDIFSCDSHDLGRTSLIEHEIKTGTHQPIFVPQFRRSRAENDLIDKHVEEMLHDNVVEDSQSAWNSPIFLVKKKDTDTKRFVVDFRKLNSITEKDRFPMLHVDDALDSLSESRLFSTIDLSSGFWQVPLSENAKPKTAFQTRKGHFQFTVMPFGLCNAPSTFQRLMNRVTEGLEMPTYLDDVIVGTTDNFLHHVSRLRELFCRLRSAGLKLKVSKCHFGKKSIRYLGFILADGKIYPDPEKVSAITQYPVPKTPSNLQTFLGMCTFYARFIKDYAKIATPLFRLQNKTPKSFCREWSPACLESFKKLRAAISADSCLALPDFTKKFCVDVDASQHAVGAVLYQIGSRHPVAFASRKLSPSQQRYSTIDREFLALHWAVTSKFRPYLYGQEFLVRTDHKPLLGLHKGKPNNARQAKFQQELSEYVFELTHIDGTQNTVADALSRSVSLLNPEAPEFIPSVAAVSLSCDTPESAEAVVLRFHSDGHFGASRTRNAILNAGYRIPYLRQLIRDCINNCHTCAAKSYGSAAIPPGHLPDASTCAAREFVALDIVGPLPNVRGHRFILTMIDHATRFLAAVPLTNVTAQTIALTFLDQWVYRYGPPRILHSDRGPQFTAAVLKNVLREIGTTKSFTTAYHPAGNGTLERVHRTLKDRLRCAAGNWLQELNRSVFLINATSTSGKSPHEMFFGSPTKLPSDWPQQCRPTHTELRVPRFVHPRIPLPPTALSPRHGPRVEVAERLSPQLVRGVDNKIYNLRSCRTVW